LRYHLEQAFVLPLPKYSEPHNPSPYPYPENRAEKASIAQFWQTQIDKVAERKVPWDHLLSLLPGELQPDHPAFSAQSSRGGQSLLHLAVYQHRIDLVNMFSKILSLKLVRNVYGQTAAELASYLDRKEEAKLLQSPCRCNFFNQTDVEIEDPQRFEPHCLEYLPHPVYESEKVFDSILQKIKRAKTEDQIPPEKIWMGVYFDKEVQTGIHPKVSIRWIDQEIGFGVFAAQRIPPCAFVGEYTGVVQERRKKHLNDNYYCVRYTVWEMGRKKFVLDAEKRGNFTRFINHSDKPNIGLQSIYWRGLPRMIFLSLREIPLGAQLTFDYGSFFWKECRQKPRCVE